MLFAFAGHADSTIQVQVAGFDVSDYLKELCLLVRETGKFPSKADLEALPDHLHSFSVYTKSSDGELKPVFEYPFPKIDCRKCRYFHGRDSIHCAVKPYGITDGKCNEFVGWV